MPSIEFGLPPAATSPYVTQAELVSEVEAAARLTLNQVAPEPPPQLPIISKALSLSTYDGSGLVVHPSVVYTDTPWNGHCYWLAITPYPDSDSAYENPSIYHSDDGLTWTAPDGLTNPIEAAPGSPNYNSDPNLVFGPDGYLYCFWRSYYADQTGAEEQFFYRRSSDGVTWGDKTFIRSDNQSTRRIMSPAFNWDGTQWVIHGVEITGDPNTVVRLTADNLTGTWSTPTAVSGITMDADRDPWHIDCHLFGGVWHAFLCDSTSGDSDGGSLYWATSTDGLTWTTTKVYGRTARTHYKPCAYPVPVAGGRRWRVWTTAYSGASDLYSKLATALCPQPDVFTAHADAMSAAIIPVYPYAVGDSFSRADASSLGTATSGQTWTASTGVPGIASGAAYATTAANTRAWIDSDLADCVVGIRFAVNPSGSQQWLVFRGSSSSNYWRFGWDGGSGYQLQKVVSGAVTVVDSGWDHILRDNTILTARMSGSDITVAIDGHDLTTVTDSHSSTGDFHGFQTNTSGTARFDDFYVRALVGGV